jgi:hypothetical protein
VAQVSGHRDEGRLTLPVDRGELVRAARAVLDANWRSEGYTVPNRAVYPFQWLWDSCFHAVAWAALGDGDRARAELRHLFRTQSRRGFVPHVDYEHRPDHHAGFWRREGQSSITQPPMFGHAVAELSRRGVAVDDLLEPAERGLAFLLRDRARIDGLVALCHPWESGGDDCPRWDHWCPGGWDPARWYDVKGELVASVEHAEDGSPLANPSFRVASCGFNALVAFNALELAAVTGDAELRDAADALVDTLDERWDDRLATWVDAGDSEATSGRVRTLDALLPLLVTRRHGAVEVVLAELLDDRAFGGACGPAGVHRAEPSYAARTYWRGPAWPQLTYLHWVAAGRRGDRPAAVALAGMLQRGAVVSGWAEYWDADDGTGLGAAPQSWAALAAVVDVPGGGPASDPAGEDRSPTGAG